MTLTRRRVLAALAAGSAGGLTGYGTSALLRDREAHSLAVTTGIVDATVAYWLDVGDDAPDLSAPDGTVDGARVDVRPHTLHAHSTQRTLFRFALPQTAGAVNNPANVWLRTACPDQSTLADRLSVRFSYSDATGGPGATIAAGSLRAVADALADGRRLDGDPSTPGSDCVTDELFVLAEYELGAYVGSDTVSLPVSFAAVQCRNTDPDRNPFPATDDGGCPPGDDCECCWAIGKVEADRPLRAGDTYPFDEGLAGYALAVTAVDGDSGVTFELVTTDGTPALPLCAVEVKGGPGFERYARTDGEFGFETGVLDGAADGVVSAPVNPNNGKRYGISHVVVSVCAPALDDGGCPEDQTRTNRRTP